MAHPPNLNLTLTCCEEDDRQGAPRYSADDGRRYLRNPRGGAKDAFSEAVSDDRETTPRMLRVGLWEGERELCDGNQLGFVRRRIGSARRVRDGASLTRNESGLRYVRLHGPVRQWSGAGGRALLDCEFRRGWASRSITCGRMCFAGAFPIGHRMTPVRT